VAVITSIVAGDSEVLQRYRRVIEGMVSRVLPAHQHDKLKIDVWPRSGVLMAVLGRTEGVQQRERAVLAGTISQRPAQSPWWRPGSSAPDGSFVLLRTHGEITEALTDYAGSRSVWHARLSPDCVVVSTCLEIITALLGDFEMDEKALGWYLSAGNCGPHRSWDRRVKPLPPNTCLRIQRSGNSVSTDESLIDHDSSWPVEVDENALEEVIREELGQMDLGGAPWLLALSGGYDSRAILSAVEGKGDIRCISWVDEAKKDVQFGDVAIARQLARSANREHMVKTLVRPETVADVENSARRFMRYCDGRTDNLLMYVDGMRMWDQVSQSDEGGILRGDELFGTDFAASQAQILSNMRALSFQDYAESPLQRDLAARFPHTLPAGLQQRGGESTSRWRLRLRSSFETPTVYSALASIRARFLETSSPLLSGRIVRFAKAMSDEDLDDKHLYKLAIRRKFPDVGFATDRSILTWPEFLALPQVKERLQEHLCGPLARELLGPLGVSSVNKALRQPVAENRRMLWRLKRQLSATIVPKWLLRYRQSLASAPALDLRVLAMRSFLVEVLRDEMSTAAHRGVGIQNDIKDAIA
jgi:hypothetical protein